ncbi:MAG: SpoIIE family protein phosphatase [Eubacteriales bacterium]|nr:SpoIIE family protein phosphatase [Eubacteriales bacterium]
MNNTENKKSGRTFTLGSKAYLLIAVIVLITAFGTLLGGYKAHSEITDGFYKDLTENLAYTVSNAVSGVQIRHLYDAARTEEYRRIYERARKTGDSTEIEAYLAGKDLLLTYQNITEMLSQFSRYMEVKYIYIQSMEDGYYLRLVDPDIGLLSFGETGELDGPFAAYSNLNTYIPATISTTSSYGSLCSAYAPVYDSENNPVAVVGVDVSMAYLGERRVRFLFSSSIQSILLAILIASIGVWLTRRNVTGPVVALSRQARSFSEHKGAYTLDDVARLDIKNRDEIGDLYMEIQRMERRIVTYLEHLIKVTDEKSRVRTELSIAAKIQQDMLPSDFGYISQRKEFELFALADPAKEVAGDFYDFYYLDDDHLVLTIADVSGKGIPAALLMAYTKILLKTQATSGASPAEILESVNSQACESNNSDMFVSVWIGILDLKTGILRAANAGHEYPALMRAGGSFSLYKDKHGLVLGAMPDMPYTEYEIALNNGDCLFLYTDGVPEATRADNTLYGNDRMINALTSAAGRHTLVASRITMPEYLVDSLLKDISVFVGNAMQFDDITMLCIQFTRDPVAAGMGDVDPAQDASDDPGLNGIVPESAVPDDALPDDGAPDDDLPDDVT